jgi:hypothetical protein
MIEVHGPSSWLFVNGDQSIHIARPDGRALIIRGPGTTRQRRDFHDEEALQRYQIAMAEQLAERGWMLYGVDRDRRVNDRGGPPPSMPDRRADDSLIERE